jgi:hypothetical protein
VCPVAHHDWKHENADVGLALICLGVVISARD